MLKNPAKLARNKLRDAEKQLVSKVFKKILKDETTERKIDGKVSYFILENQFTHTSNQIIFVNSKYICNAFYWLQGTEMQATLEESVDNIIEDMSPVIQGI